MYSSQAKIGIRREDKNKWERRAPLAPQHVAELVKSGIAVAVQPSPRRVFSDADYAAVGATLEEDLSDCTAVFGVKEMPKNFFNRGGCYVFFSHTIKGQPYNMPLLAQVLTNDATLIDYERIVDASGRRLVFFGRFAGVAGMIDSLAALGQRLAVEGFKTPLKKLQAAYRYGDLEAAKQAVKLAGEHIANEGLPATLAPLVVGVTGYGNVARGAQEILDLLPIERITPADLVGLSAQSSSRKVLYSVVFEERHMFVRNDGAPFDLQRYFANPSEHHAVFEKYLPHLTVLANCIYWDKSGPRLVTNDAIAALYAEGQPRLRVIGDISCDIAGSIECTVKSTAPDAPVYVYEAGTGAVLPGVKGKGPVIMAVDNLPCELPRESSTFFGDCLLPFVPAIARLDTSASYDDLALPAEVKGAVIAHGGSLSPGYTYLRQSLTEGV